MSFNGASIIFGHVSTVMKQRFSRRQAKLIYWNLLLAKLTATQLLPHSENERQQSVNDLWLFM
jgi:hypothetical protein